MALAYPLMADYSRAYRLVKTRYPALNLHFLGATCFLALLAGLATAVPYLLRQTINALTLAAPSTPSWVIILLAGSYGVCWTAAHTLEWIKNMLSAAILARCDAAFHSVLYQHLLHVEYHTLVNIDSGTLASQVARSRQAFSSLTFTLFWTMLPTLFQLLLSSLILFTTAGLYFSLAFMLSLFLLFMLTLGLSALSKNAHSAIFNADDRLLAHFIEKIRFCFDIRINNAYQKETTVIRQLLKEYIRAISGGNARLAALLALQVLCTGIILTLFTLVSVYWVISGKFQVGDFIMVSGYILALTAPFTMIAASLSELRRNHLALTEGFDILMLKQQPHRTPLAFPSRAPVLWQLDKVNVAYQQRLILQDVDLVLQPDRMTLIYGPSGNGKTTLLHLLLGLLPPGTGQVQFKGINVQQLTTADIVSQVAVVPQQPMILTGSIRENLAFGCEDLPAEAMLLEIVTDLELDTLVPAGAGPILDYCPGQRGTSLSGGEQQRLALGRALARCPAILIADEPVSQQDPARAERLIAVMKRRVATLIIISHSEALFSQAQDIIQIKNKQVTAIARSA